MQLITITTTDMIGFVSTIVKNANTIVIFPMHQHHRLHPLTPTVSNRYSYKASCARPG